MFFALILNKKRNASIMFRTNYDILGTYSFCTCALDVRHQNGRNFFFQSDEYCRTYPMPSKDMLKVGKTVKQWHDLRMFAANI